MVGLNLLKEENKMFYKEFQEVMQALVKLPVFEKVCFAFPFPHILVIELPQGLSYGRLINQVEKMVDMNYSLTGSYNIVESNGYAVIAESVE